jgi:probable HAF family extracellular repeat protein
MRHNYLVLSVAFLLVTAPFVLAQGTYTQIDYPGASATFGQSINTVGDVVGTYNDSSGNTHGFLLSNGVYTSIDYPGATQGTYTAAINDKGQIVGTSLPSGQGFLYEVQTQTFTTLSAPNSTETWPYAINNAGLIGGYELTSSAGQIAFALWRSKYFLLSPPPGNIGSSVQGVTDNGELVVGNGQTGPTGYFTYSDGQYSQITLPTELYIYLFGVNPQGTAYVGFYQTNNNNPSAGYGYVFQNQALTTLQFPGASSTAAEGINRWGEVVGRFTDSSNHTHAFTWTPTP